MHVDSESAISSVMTFTPVSRVDFVIMDMVLL